MKCTNAIIILALLGCVGVVSEACLGQLGLTIARARVATILSLFPQLADEIRNGQLGPNRNNNNNNNMFDQFGGNRQQQQGYPNNNNNGYNNQNGLNPNNNQNGFTNPTNGQQQGGGFGNQGGQQGLQGQQGQQGQQQPNLNNNNQARPNGLAA